MLQWDNGCKLLEGEGGQLWLHLYRTQIFLCNATDSFILNLQHQTNCFKAPDQNFMSILQKEISDKIRHDQFSQ